MAGAETPPVQAFLSPLFLGAVPGKPESEDICDLYNLGTDPSASTIDIGYWNGDFWTTKPQCDVSLGARTSLRRLGPDDFPKYCRDWKDKGGLASIDYARRLRENPMLTLRKYSTSLYNPEVPFRYPATRDEKTTIATLKPFATLCDQVTRHTYLTRARQRYRDCYQPIEQAQAACSTTFNDCVKRAGQRAGRWGWFSSPSEEEKRRMEQDRQRCSQELQACQLSQLDKLAQIRTYIDALRTQETACNENIGGTGCTPDQLITNFNDQCVRLSTPQQQAR